MSAVVGYDAIAANITRLPNGQCAGYTTGSPDIRWTTANFDARPGAVRICQDAGASDTTADVLDVERYAATNAEAAAWYKAALKAYESATRPGQRSPAVYTSASNVTALVDALVAGAVKSGPSLWVANWNLTQAQAYVDVVNAAGPFPIVAVQFSSGQFYDTDVFSGGWLSRVSGDSSGSHKHLTVAGDTLGSLADSRNMDVWKWLAEQRKLSDPQATHLVRHAAPEVGSTWRSQ